jgi:hypothetical protein
MGGGNTVQGLNETRHGLPAGLLGAAHWQSDIEVVRSIRIRAIKLEVGSDVSGLFAESSGGAHHFAGYGVDLIGRKPTWMLALAAAEKKKGCREQNKRNCRAKPATKIKWKCKNPIC